MTTEPQLTSNNAGHRLEAATGIEPVLRALQAPTNLPLTSDNVGPHEGRDHIVTTQELEAQIDTLAKVLVTAATVTRNLIHVADHGGPSNWRQFVETDAERDWLASVDRIDDLAGRAAHFKSEGYEHLAALTSSSLLAALDAAGADTPGHDD